MLDRETYLRQSGSLSSQDLASPRFRRVETRGDRITEIAESLGNVVFGQEEACVAVAKSIVRSEAGLSDPNAPLGVFIFLGPTGVGKSEMAKAISTLMAARSGNYENAGRHLINIDGTTLQDQTSVSRLTGASPNYIGYGDPPLITPDQMIDGVVVCFDEIDKAHPSVARWLLPAIDKGVTKVSVGTGKQRDGKQEIAMADLNFRRSIIVLTANVGASEIVDTSRGKHLGFLRPADEGEVTRERIRSAGLKALEAHFRSMPEFLGRIGAANVIVFNELTDEDFLRIFDKAIARINMNQEVSSPRDYHPILVTKEMRDLVIRLARMRALGARAIKQTIEDLISGPAARVKLDGVLSKGAPLIADLEDGRTVFHTSDINLSPASENSSSALIQTTASAEVAADASSSEPSDSTKRSATKGTHPTSASLRTMGENFASATERVLTRGVLYVVRRKWPPKEHEELKPID